MTNQKLDDYLKAYPGKSVTNKYLYTISLNEIYDSLV